MVATAVEPANYDWLRPWLGGAALVAAAGGGIFSGLAYEQNHAVGNDSSQLARTRTNQRIHGYNVAAVTAYITAGVLGSAYAWWTAVHQEPRGAESPP